MISTKQTNNLISNKLTHQQTHLPTIATDRPHSGGILEQISRANWSTSISR